MKIELTNLKEHVLILGAGASVDYGLPTWDKLALLIEEKLKKTGEKYEYKEEILSWMSKVGKDREHDTIDHCITKESRSKAYHTNGLTIENNIFLIMKNIFKELYKENHDGWISRLNQKILDSDNLEHQIAFINYNYDNVLDENILHFEYLTEKERKVDYRSRISELSRYYIPAFFPHGNFFSENEFEKTTHLYRNLRTKKSDLDDVVDAISCHESERHVVEKLGSNTVKLYVLGLGGGLKINLSNILFKKPASEIHVTIKDKIKKDDILNFLNEQYAIPQADIKIYETCEELIEKCF